MTHHAITAIYPPVSVKVLNTRPQPVASPHPLFTRHCIPAAAPFSNASLSILAVQSSLNITPNVNNQARKKYSRINMQLHQAHPPSLHLITP